MEIPSRPWIELPTDLTVNILGRLEALEILESAQKVCTIWWRVCKDYPEMWRVITIKRVAGEGERYRRLPSRCRRAVDRSRGQLTDLSLLGFGDPQLLNYVVDRSSNLRRLSLDLCVWISAKALAEAVQKLPHLEELHLFSMVYQYADDVAAIGKSCPAVKSFTFNNERYERKLENYDYELEGEIDYNEFAAAIARTMPNLVHLRLYGHWMKSEGLEAILKGCPRLESLDIRKCTYLSLGWGLGERCSRQIKDLLCDPVDEDERLGAREFDIYFSY